MTRNRTRKIKSFYRELLKKSKESMLCAVQIFNNPNISFKAESFIVLAVIAWTYLFHAYYKSKGIDYRYCQRGNKRRKFDRTKYGAFKHWELERCLNDDNSPIDKDTANNLKFLIGLRHEIEHQMTTKLDDLLSARFQACCLNYNNSLKALFKDEGIDKFLSFSIQFAQITKEQKDLLQNSDLPQHILTYIENFDNNLSPDEFNSSKFAYRILFVPKLVNHKGQAERCIEFVKSDSELAKNINKEYVAIKETERKKFLPKKIVEMANKQGYKKFSIHRHTKLWQEKDAKNPSKGYGVLVEKQWYWYEKWVDEVLRYCETKKDDFI